MPREAQEQPVNKKQFTLEEANQMLPLVRAIVTDIVRQFKEVSERRERLAMVSIGDEEARGDPYREEVEQIKHELEKDARQLQAYVDELRELGVEPKDFVMGLVDFPSTYEGREVYLCWHLGEPEVTYWHELEAGFSGRRRLEVGVEG